MRHAVIALCVVGLAGGAPPVQTDSWESRLRVDELYARAGEPDQAENGLKELLKEPDLPPPIRTRAEKQLRDVLALRRARKDEAEAIARIRLGMARALIKDGEYTQARQIASGVLEKADSVPLAEEAEKVYEESQPGFGTRLWDRAKDISKWEWVLFAAPVLAILAALIALRMAFWFLRNCYLGARLRAAGLPTPTKWLVTFAVLLGFGYCLGLLFLSRAVPAVPSGMVALALLVIGVLWLPGPTGAQVGVLRAHKWAADRPILVKVGVTLVAVVALGVVPWFVALPPITVDRVVPMVGIALAVLLGVAPWLPGPVARPARLGQFEDPTNSGALALVIDSFARWSSRGHADESTSGLLVSEASRVPTVPFLKAEAGDLLPDFGTLPAVGGVSVGAVVSVLQAVVKWFRPPYPILAGSVRVDDTRAQVQPDLAAVRWYNLRRVRERGQGQPRRPRPGGRRRGELRNAIPHPGRARRRRSGQARP